MHEMFFGFTTIRYVGDVPKTQLVGQSTNTTALESAGGG